MTDKRVIHLVDDEEAIRRAAGFALKAVGLGVETYASGVEFLARARPTTQGGPEGPDPQGPREGHKGPAHKGP